MSAFVILTPAYRSLRDLASPFLSCWGICSPTLISGKNLFVRHVHICVFTCCLQKRLFNWFMVSPRIMDEGAFLFSYAMMITYVYIVNK